MKNFLALLNGTRGQRAKVAAELIEEGTPFVYNPPFLEFTPTTAKASQKKPAATASRFTKSSI